MALLLGLKQKTIGKTEARQRLLPLINELDQSNKAVEITDHDKPVAVLIGYHHWSAVISKLSASAKLISVKPKIELMGSVKIIGDLEAAGKRMTKEFEKAKQAFVDAIDNKSRIIYVPSHVMWEISRLVENDAIVLSVNFFNWIGVLFDDHSMLLSQPFDKDTVIYSHGLKFHNDPFDRAIVATALQPGLPLITNDSVIHNKKPCAIYWD